MSYQDFDIDQDTNAQEYVRQQNDNKLIIPTILLADGLILVEPNNAELFAELGLQTTASRNFYDLIIVGSGPAWLAEVLYTAREEISTLLVYRSEVVCQAGTTQLLENYPGFPRSIGGAELTESMK
mgnify:FL=1